MEALYYVRSSQEQLSVVRSSKRDFMAHLYRHANQAQRAGVHPYLSKKNAKAPLAVWRNTNARGREHFPTHQSTPAPSRLNSVHRVDTHTCVNVGSHTRPGEARAHCLTFMRKVLTVAVQWPVYVRDTVHRWDNASFHLFLRTVARCRFRSSVPAS